MAKDEKNPIRSEFSAPKEPAPNPAPIKTETPTAPPAGDEANRLRAGLVELAEWLAGEKPLLADRTAASVSLPMSVRKEMNQRGQHLRTLIDRLPVTPATTLK